VVAQKQHDQLFVTRFAVDFRPGMQLLPRETFGQQRQEIPNRRVGGQLVVRRVHHPLHALRIEVGKLALQVRHPTFERPPHVEGQRDMQFGPGGGVKCHRVSAAASTRSAAF
jgi:hypothetical protein